MDDAHVAAFVSKWSGLSRVIGIIILKFFIYEYKVNMAADWRTSFFLFNKNCSINNLR